MSNNKKNKKLNERGKKRLNAKLECHLVGPHALSHDVSKRETFCNNFYSTIFLQFFFFTHFLNWIIIIVMCVQFLTVVSLHIYSFLKVRLIFHPKKKKGKIKTWCGQVCMHVSYRWFKTMVEYGFTLRTKYSLYLYTQNKNHPTKLPKPKSYLIS